LIDFAEILYVDVLVRIVRVY